MSAKESTGLMVKERRHAKFSRRNCRLPTARALLVTAGHVAMKTVLVYATNLLPWSETFIREQILALRRWRGVLIGMRQAHQLSLDGIDVCMLRPDPPTSFDRIRWKLSTWLGTVPGPTVSRLKKERPSLLHAHFGVEAVKAWPIAKALDLPMVVTLHGYDININRDWWEAGQGGPAMRNYPTRLLELARNPRISFIAVSEAIRRRAISYGIPAERIVVRYIGVDTSNFAPSGRPITERDRRVLFVGRLVEKKGCEYLIKAFSKMQNAVPDASLIVVGDGPLSDSLRLLARRLNVRAQFRGSLSSADVRMELHLARVLCLPSITADNGDSEGLPIVLLEAQASGIPIVTSACSGSLEGVSQGVTGFVVPERDLDTLTERLMTLLTDDDIASSMASAGPSFVPQLFDIHRCTQMLEDVYDAFIARDLKLRP